MKYPSLCFVLGIAEQDTNETFSLLLPTIPTLQRTPDYRPAQPFLSHNDDAYYYLPPYTPNIDPSC